MVCFNNFKSKKSSGEGEGVRRKDIDKKEQAGRWCNSIKTLRESCRPANPDRTRVCGQFLSQENPWPTTF